MAWPPAAAIIVPLDFSDMSQEALRVALEIGGGPSRVTALYVLPDVSPLEPVMPGQPVDEKLRLEHADQMLVAWLQSHGGAGVSHGGAGVSHAVVPGDPGHEIARYAADKQAGLIVMPSHGRTGLARMLLGSVAERALRLAHCPVLILRK